MATRTAATDVSRRDALKAVGAVVAGAAFGLSDSRRAEGQTPKRGGVFRICAFTDPSGFDVKNIMPNLGNDYGGRLMAAWLDK